MTQYRTDEYKSDKEKQLNLQRMRVRTYADAIKRGFKDWANGNPPKSSEIHELLDWWKYNDATGKHLIPILENVLRERSQAVILSCQLYRERLANEELAQKVHVIDLNSH